MAQDNWSGIHIPIITPFQDDYSIDEDGLRRLVDYCIEEQKADGLTKALERVKYKTFLDYIGFL